VDTDFSVLLAAESLERAERGARLGRGVYLRRLPEISPTRLPIISNIPDIPPMVSRRKLQDLEMFHILLVGSIALSFR